MKFRLFLHDGSIDAIVVSIDRKPESHVIWIRNSGLERANTAYPQPEVDYDRTRFSFKCPKIIGVDMI